MQRASGAKKRGPKRRRRVLAGVLVGLPLAAVALFVAANRVEWVGPLVAESLRALLGNKAVAALEDFAYSVEDRVYRFSRRGEAPQAYWSVPPKRAAAPVAKPGAPPAPRFQPGDVGPVHQSWSAPGDGQWVPIVDARRPGEEPHLQKTLLHPDRNRSWAELFVVAADLERVRLQAVAGLYEPRSFEKEAMKYKRSGLVATALQPDLLAAFNGGWRTEHGGYGMKVDGVTLVKPRKSACAVAAYPGDAVRIATWASLESTEPTMLWYRQAPGCMYENGQRHVGLAEEMATAWGATVDGETVIRRSAVGLSADGRVLYVGITNHTTARALADGMHHAGAASVAQLDVNWSYPKIVTFEADGGGELQAVALAKGFELHDDDYVRRPAPRDFFYLAKKPEPPASN